MDNKCNYTTFFNEFTPKLKTKLLTNLLYNGYFFSKNYKRHLQKTIDRFRDDLLHALPFNTDGNPEIFLKNLHTELCENRSKLIRYKKRLIAKGNSYSIPINRKIYDRIAKRPKRRISIQLRTLNIALNITEQAIESFSQTYERNEINPEIAPENNYKTGLETISDIIWPTDKIGLIQLMKTLIKMKVILIGSLKENEAVTIIAKFFNTSVDRNNFSSYSRAIHSNNHDYQPKIFDKIIKGYEIIVHQKREELYEKKK